MKRQFSQRSKICNNKYCLKKKNLNFFWICCLRDFKLLSIARRLKLKYFLLNTNNNDKILEFIAARDNLQC